MICATMLTCGENDSLVKQLDLMVAGDSEIYCDMSHKGL
jgi:hypothetical protein